MTLHTLCHTFYYYDTGMVLLSLLVLEVLFDQSSYDTSEDSGTTDIRVVSIGTTIIPIEVLITTRDGTAIGKQECY